jgi:hypothetical protein
MYKSAKDPFYVSPQTPVLSHYLQPLSFTDSTVRRLLSLANRIIFIILNEDTIEDCQKQFMLTYFKT